MQVYAWVIARRRPKVARGGDKTDLFGSRWDKSVLSQSRIAAVLTVGALQNGPNEGDGQSPTSLVLHPLGPVDLSPLSNLPGRETLDSVQVPESLIPRR